MATTSAEMSHVAVSDSAPPSGLAEGVPLRGFRVSVGLGGVVNMLFALPALFAPRFLEGLIEIKISNTPYWLMNVGILLVIISAMYIPAIRAPYRYLFIAYLLVAGRFAAGLMFLTGLLFMDFPSGFWALAATDLLLSPIQAAFLYAMLRKHESTHGGAGHGEHAMA